MQQGASNPIANIAGLTHTMMPVSEIMDIAVDSFKAAKMRFALTTFGIFIGTASLIMVVTIALTGKQYILGQIRGIGANMVYASYEGGGATAFSTFQQDFLTVDDIRAVREQVPSVRAASPMLEMHERIPLQGKERELRVLGVDPEYRIIRNLKILAGRFFDEDDAVARHKAAMISPELAQKLYGTVSTAVGSTLHLRGLAFIVVGVYAEQVETFGQSEISKDTVLIPYSVARYFVPDHAVKLVFFSIANAEHVPEATVQIHRVIAARHRPESTYRVRNLTEVLAVAERTADALSIVLLLVSILTLIVGGVGIMNIMLSNVQTRIREIGIRKALGATNREIQLQFLMEAVIISLVGGVTGVLLGLAIPFSTRFFTGYEVPISSLSVVVALVVACGVGVGFGAVPAARAARMNPVDALRYE